MLLVSYQRHFQPLFRYIKDKIDAGELGEVQYIAGLQDQDWFRGTKGSGAASSPLRWGPAQRLGQPPAGHPALDDRPRRGGGELLPGGLRG